MKILFWIIGGVSALALLGLSIPKKKRRETIEGNHKNPLYRMTAKERLWSFLYAAAVIFAVGYLFYRSMLVSALLMPLALLYPKIREAQLIRQRKRQMSLQFKEALHCISTSLVVGKSIENAFREAPAELLLLYPDENTTIVRELQKINRALEMNFSIEEAIQDFANRTELEDVSYFSEVFILCKRTGGNLVEVVRNTSRIISEKQDFLQELELMLAQRKFEQRLLSVIPIFLIFALSATSPDYMNPVFTTLAGRIAMTVAIGLFLIAFYIANKIIEIEV